MRQTKRQQNDNHILSHNYLEVMICTAVESPTSIVYWKIFTYIIQCIREEFKEIRKSDDYIFIMARE